MLRMPAPKWKRFEQLVAAIHYAETQGAVVHWDEKINGRQFDVTVRFKHGLHEYLTVIECKDKTSKVNAEEVDALVTKARDANADKAVIVSSIGFQSGCMPVAERHNIKLLVLTETATIDQGDLVAQVVPTFNIHTVRFERAGEKEYELEDLAGSLQYLVTQTIVRWGESKFTPAHTIDQWLAKPESQSMTNHTVRVAFKGGALVEVPHEEPFTAIGMSFKIQLINAFVADGPMIEPHVVQSLATKIALRTVDGKVVYEAKLTDVPFGFDTVLEPGKFYEDPRVNTRVHCDWIKDNVVHLTLVESYQHGMLIQVRMRAKVDKARGYIQITDQPTITRLQKMLDKLNAHDAETANPNKAG